MSLLMQALKRAEHAKQKHSDLHETEADQESAAGNPLREPISLTPIETHASPDANAGARDYPEIIAPVEEVHKIELARPDAIADAAAQTVTSLDSPRIDREITLTFEPAATRDVPDAPVVPPPVAPDLKPAPSAASAAPEVHADSKASTAQIKARAVFASKQLPAAKRTALMAMAGVTLAAILLAGFGYYYWQTTTGNSNFATPGAQPPVQAAPAEPLPATAPPSTDTAGMPAPENAVTPPGAATSVPASTAPQEPAPAAQPVPQAADTGSASAADRRSESVSTAGAAPPQSDTIRIRQGNNPNHIHPALADAYQLFSAGDMAAAHQQYRRVLRQEPNNRDALLGMAAIALNRKQAEQAGAFYAKLLELDPADPDAIAGLASLKQGDPAQSESGLKKVLAQDPQADAVLFALGNLYAQQARWAEAQQYYFRAFGSAQDNADYAFNLAVSLDRLNQGKLALEYYQRALTLSKNTQTSFDKSAVQRRAIDLKASLGD